MAVQTLSSIRDFVRNAMEASVNDVPNALIDLWAQDALYMLTGRTDRWPFYAATWSLPTVIGTRDYSLTSMNVDIIESIHVTSGLDGRELWRITFEDGLGYYSGVNDINAPVEYWAVRGETLSLFPRPAAVYTLTLVGFRNPTNFVDQGAGAAPDMPERFHTAVAYYCLAQAYGKQEDTQMAAYWMSQFERTAVMAERETLVQHRGRVQMARGFATPRTFKSWYRSLHRGSGF